MKENIFTHKILPILSILILVSFIFISNNVFAYESTDEYTFPETLVDGHAYFIYYEKNQKQFYGQVFRNVDNVDGLYFKVDNSNYMHIYDSTGKELDSTGVRVIWTGDLENWGFQDYSQLVEFKFSDNILIKSSHDIFNNDGTLFFQPTPPTIIPETVEIPAVETVEQIPVAMTETLKMIIPVGLVVLSIFLVIYLVRRLICLFS